MIVALAKGKHERELNGEAERAGSRSGARSFTEYRFRMTLDQE